jgi:integrase
VGTVQRLAFDLALHTAQRRSDVRVMGPQHVTAGSIRERQLKTEKELVIPMHPRLTESILATKTGHLAFITSAKGAPFSTIGSKTTRLPSATEATAACQLQPLSTRFDANVYVGMQTAMPTHKAAMCHWFHVRLLSGTGARSALNSDG